MVLCEWVCADPQQKRGPVVSPSVLAAISSLLAFPGSIDISDALTRVPMSERTALVGCL